MNSAARRSMKFICAWFIPWPVMASTKPRLRSNSECWIGGSNKIERFCLLNAVFLFICAGLVLDLDGNSELQVIWQFAKPHKLFGMIESNGDWEKNSLWFALTLSCDSFVNEPLEIPWALGIGQWARRAMSTNTKHSSSCQMKSTMSTNWH